MRTQGSLGLGDSWRPNRVQLEEGAKATLSLGFLLPPTNPASYIPRLLYLSFLLPDWPELIPISPQGEGR